MKHFLFLYLVLCAERPRSAHKTKKQKIFRATPNGNQPLIAHSFVPSLCIETLLVPIVKSHNYDISSSANCRPIALASIISKLFEHFILIKIKPLFSTNENQFGFKQSHSTDQ